MNGILAEIAERAHLDLTLVRHLAGGEQGGAHLVATPEGHRFVLKLQPDPQKAERLLAAVPVVRHGVARGWPAAAWVHAGMLNDGSAFLVQEYVAGRPLGRIDTSTMHEIVAANRRQSGLALSGAFDDSAQLHAVVAGEHPWRELVRSRSAAGAALVAKGDEVVRALGEVELPVSDLVHGDYSGANLIRSDAGGIFFIDAETVARGTRARDLADLYRQCFLMRSSSSSALGVLREEGCGVAGREVFDTCVVAVSYNNLAWWVGHRSREDFDDACARLNALFEQFLTSTPA